MPKSSQNVRNGVDKIIKQNDIVNIYIITKKYQGNMQQD